MNDHAVTRRGLLGAAIGGLTVTGLAAAAPPAWAAVAAGPAGVLASHAYLADAVTGADLWSRSSTAAEPMGSITKVMTAYLVIGANTLSRVVSVPEAIYAYDGSSASTAGLSAGERLTTRDLLIGMMLPSGCDAAYALAAAYGPGTGAFIGKMNAAARSLGLGHTHFADFSGLPVGGEYATESSAGNLVTLGRAAMRQAAFRQIVALRSYRVPAGAHNHAHSWTNLNPLLGHYPGAVGIKTGYTSAAGDCLLFAATRATKSLIGVVLHSSSSVTGLAVAASDAEKILTWGFAHYR
jgi:D-alanyl-D-alanine carboxypeptidase (penicillin-binding protein 5/6)